MGEPAAFDIVGKEYIESLDEVRGYIRQEVTRQHLREYLSAWPMQVLDLGGGDGRDSFWLAAMGHQVVLADISTEMLEPAAQRRAHADSRVAEAVQILHGDEREVRRRFGSGRFDLVLSHGVLLYQDDPDEHLARTVDLVKPNGGMLSLLTKGFYGGLMRLMKAGDIEMAKQFYHTQRTRNNRDLDVTAYRPDQISEMLQAAGLRTQDWYGVRIAHDDDRRKIGTVSAGELAALVDWEIGLSEQDDCRGLGQMLHFIARK